LQAEDVVLAAAALFDVPLLVFAGVVAALAAAWVDVAFAVVLAVVVAFVVVVSVLTAAFAVVFAAAVVVPFAGASTAAAAPWDTTVHPPNPAVVLTETKQRFFALPPTHLVPAGRVKTTLSDSTLVGAGLPLVLTVPATNDFPRPVWSTSTETDVDPSAPALKFTTFMVTVPSAATGIAVDVSIVVAGLMLPQGCAVEGRCTSLRWGVPLTPRAGLGIACAEVCAARARKTEAQARTDLLPENIMV